MSRTTAPKCDTVDLPDGRTTIIEPAPKVALPNEKESVLNALDHPIGARPLREWLTPGARV
ncbi:MAG: hypothetical protein V4587_05220, partial [Acidobacteriota bacterium]